MRPKKIKIATKKEEPSETHSAVKCYDVEAQGWRSFIIENVLKFSLVEIANDF